MKFNNSNILCRALTNKIHEIEFQQKNNAPYPYGNNEDLSGIGQQFLEFFFLEYLLRRGYPNKMSQLKKYSDMVTLKQKLLCEKNLSEIAFELQIQNLVQVGNQVAIKKNPKILSETLKAIIGAHYYDSQFDLDHLRDVLQPLLKELLDKGQQIKVPELKNNAKSAFLEFISNYIDLKPKISCEWKKKQVNEGIVENIYAISLELDQYFSITKEGTNKKNTEQLVYKEGLIKLRQAYKNLTKSKAPSNQQLNQQENLDLKQSISEGTLTFEIDDDQDITNISQFLEFGNSFSLSKESSDQKKRISQNVDQFLAQYQI